MSGDGGPEVGEDGRSILFTGASLSTNPLQFTYQVSVPAGATGPQSLNAQVEYHLAGAVNAQSLTAQPQPLMVEMSSEEDLTITGADVPGTGIHTFEATRNLTVSGDVTVQNGVQLNLRAGSRIGFVPGFRVQAGGRLNARIGSSP